MYQSSNEKIIDQYSYSVGNFIGQGSYSKVYLGKNFITNKQVAIKMITNETLQDTVVNDMILNEIDVMKQCKVNQIVKLEKVIFTQNNAYIIQEYCNRGDLEKVLQSNNILSEDKSIKILYDIAQAYQELLRLNIIHRDIKPANIFVHDDQFKLGDFGLSKILKSSDEMTQGNLIGTPSYMSPQCLNQEPYSQKADMWSLGMMFYEVLFGFMPFYGNTPDELYENLTKTPLKFPKNSKISQKSKDFLLRALKVNEKDRISWQELIEHSIFDHLNKGERKFKQSYSNYEKKTETLDDISQSSSIILNKAVLQHSQQKKRLNKHQHSNSIEIINTVSYQIYKNKKKLDIMFQYIQILHKIKYLFTKFQNTNYIQKETFIKISWWIVFTIIEQVQPFYKIVKNPIGYLFYLVDKIEQFEEYYLQQAFLSQKNEIEAIYQIQLDQLQILTEQVMQSTSVVTELQMHKIIDEQGKIDFKRMFSHLNQFCLQILKEITHNFFQNPSEELKEQLFILLLHIKECMEFNRDKVDIFENFNPKQDLNLRIDINSINQEEMESVLNFVFQ